MPTGDCLLGECDVHFAGDVRSRTLLFQLPKEFSSPPCDADLIAMFSQEPGNALPDPGGGSDHNRFSHDTMLPHVINIYFSFIPAFSTLVSQTWRCFSSELFTGPKYETFTGFTPQNSRVDFFSWFTLGFPKIKP